MQNASVYRSPVEDLYNSSALLTRAAARPRTSSANRSLERDASGAFPTPLSYSSSPQPVRAGTGAGQALSRSFDGAGDASTGSTGAFGAPYPQGPNLNAPNQLPYPYQNGSLSEQPPYPYSGSPLSGPIYGQPPPAPSSSGYSAPPVGFNVPSQSAPPPVGFNVSASSPAPPPPPRDNLGPNEQIGAPTSVQKAQG